MCGGEESLLQRENKTSIGKIGEGGGEMKKLENSLKRGGKKKRKRGSRPDTPFQEDTFFFPASTKRKKGDAVQARG